MIKIIEQEFVKRYDALPESFREEFLSDENVNMLWTIGEAHHLSGERIQKIAGVVGYAVLGLIHLEDISKEVAIEAGVDKRLADELTREIQLKILNPIIPQLRELYHYGSADSPQAIPGSPTPSQPQQIRPTFAPPSSSDQPFILHEEQVEIKQVRPRDETLVRPSFYDPSTGSGQERQKVVNKPAAARLEIGGTEEERRKEPQIGKTETEKVRVVHYSGPQTPVDPFGRQTPDISNQSSEAKEQRAEPPEDIHPENIVDLKDLPK